jgi:hypothetical protein
MGMPAFGFKGYAVVPPPTDGFWRVSSWREPLDPPPPAPPPGSSPQDDDGHRYDDPDGRFRTLYCASVAAGALGECLGDFAYSAATAQRIEAFLLSDPDPGSDEDYQRPLRAEDIECFGWKLAHAPAETQTTFIDVDSWRTYVAAAPRAIPALARYGVKRLDRHTLLDERRYVTRTMAGVWRCDATDEVTRELRAAGLRFTSRLPPAWQCWGALGAAGSSRRPGDRRGCGHPDRSATTCRRHARRRAYVVVAVARVRQPSRGARTSS